MADGVLDSLIVALEADTSQLRAQLGQALTAVDGYANSVASILGTHGNKITSFGNTITAAFKKAGEALLAYLAIDQINRQIDSLTQLAHAAENVGIAVDKYQALQAAAKENGAEAQQFSAAIQQLGDSFGLLQTKSGKLYEFLLHSLPTVLDQISAQKDLGGAINVVADTMRRLGTQQERILFAQKVLGDGSAGIVKTFSQGAAALHAQADEAERYGVVVGIDAVNATVKFRKELGLLGDVITTAIANKMGPTLGILASTIAKMVELQAVADETNAKGKALSGSFDGLKDRALEAALNELAGDLKRINEVAENGGHQGTWIGRQLDAIMGPSVQANLERVKGQMAAINAELDKRHTEANWANVEVKKEHDLSILPKPNYTAIDALTDLNKRLAESTDETFAVIQIQYDQDVEKFRRMVEDKLLTDKQFNEARQKLSLASAKEIAAAYEKEMKDVRAAFEGASQVLDTTFNDALTNVVQTGRVGIKQLISDLLLGMAKVVQEALIVKPLLQSLFGDPSKPGTFGIMGTLLSGLTSSLGLSLTGHAAGGPEMAGAPRLVGENGPEVFVPSTAGYTYSNNSSQSMFSGGASTTFNIDARNADAGLEQRIYQVLARVMGSQSPAPVQVRDYARRFPTR